MSNADQESEAKFSRLFKELFLTTANELADIIQEPLTDIGVLFDEILDTGTERKLQTARRLLRKSNRPSNTILSQDIEAEPAQVLFGRGQVLFLVRKVAKADVTRLQASGFRFARVMHIIDLLGKTMEVNKDQFEEFLPRRKDYVSPGNDDGDRVRLSLFALRPLLNRGFEILVQKARTNKLPYISLPTVELNSWQANILGLLDNSSVKEIREKLRRLSVSSADDQTRFAGQFLTAIDALEAMTGHASFEEARLVAKPLEISSNPSRPQDGSVQMIALRLVFDAHDPNTIGVQCDFSPLKFFLARQHVPLLGCDDAFSAELRREFIYCADQRLPKDSAIPHSPSRFIFRPNSSSQPQGTTRKSSLFAKQSRRAPSFGCGSLTKDDSSERGLVIHSSSKQVAHIESNTEPGGLPNPIGEDEAKGIELEDTTFMSGSEAPSEGDVETYADKLLTMTLNDQRKQ